MDKTTRTSQNIASAFNHAGLAPDSLLTCRGCAIFRSRVGRDGIVNTSLVGAPIGARAGEEMRMKLALGQWSVCMRRDQLIALRDARGIRVSCVDGALWITQERSPADVVIEGGQSTVIDAPGLTLVMALSSATVRLRECAPRVPGLWQTLARWLQAGGLRPGGVH